MGAALACIGVLAAVPGWAQVYRCEEGNRVIYSDKPCPGNGRTLNVGPARNVNRPAGNPTATPSRPPTGVEDLARKCAAGSPAACRTHKTLQQFDLQRAEATKLCAGGERAACDLIDCIDKNDHAACARAEGRSTEAGWIETGRRIEVRPGGRSDSVVPGERVTVINARCDHGGAPVIEIGSAGVRVVGQATRFESLAAAAGYACRVEP